MKKNFYVGLIALTALTVTSCSNDDVVMQSPEVNKAIEFGTYVGRDAVSRGHVIEVDELAKEFSKNAITQAKNAHDREKNVNDYIEMYNYIYCKGDIDE